MVFPVVVCGFMVRMGHAGDTGIGRPGRTYLPLHCCHGPGKESASRGQCVQTAVELLVTGCDDHHLRSWIPRSGPVYTKSAFERRGNGRSVGSVEGGSSYSCDKPPWRSHCWAGAVSTVILGPICANETLLLCLSPLCFNADFKGVGPPLVILSGIYAPLLSFTRARISMDSQKVGRSAEGCRGLE